MAKVEINAYENKNGRWTNRCGGCGKPINSPAGNYCKWCGAMFKNKTVRHWYDDGKVDEVAQKGV